MTLHSTAMPVVGEVGLTARLFGETNGRFLVEVQPDQVAALRRIVGDCPLQEIGVVGGDALRVLGDGGKAIIDLPVAALTEAWRGGVA
jgi:phosphoribosylformylglycinamidine (FGAM) synthase-like enzyme